MPSPTPLILPGGGPTTTAATGQVSVTSTATVVRVTRGTRQNLMLQNIGAQTAYWGKDNTVTTTTGFPVPAGTELDEDMSQGIYTGDVYMICAGGQSTTIAYREVG